MGKMYGYKISNFIYQKLISRVLVLDFMKYFNNIGIYFTFLKLNELTISFYYQLISFVLLSILNYVKDHFAFFIQMPFLCVHLSIF